MTQVELSPDEWTKIVDGQGDDAIDIRSMLGSFLCSLAVADADGAATIAMRPVPPDGGAGASLWDKRTVEPGIAVFARAVSAKAIASIAPVPA